MKPCNENLEKALVLAEEMIRLAEKGDAEREDVGCGILYGILRDSGFRIQQLVEKEKAAHMEKGAWP